MIVINSGHITNDTHYVIRIVKWILSKLTVVF